MSRTCVIWALVLAAVSGCISTGCIAGVHHHHVSSPFHYGEEVGQASGTINSVDLGIVADFRYARLSLPFEGQRRELTFNDAEGETTFFSISQVVENRTLRLDVPLFMFRSFSDEPITTRYPGAVPRRHSLELWGSASMGVVPIQPYTGTLGLTYYRYGSVAVRLYGGWSMTPYDGLVRGIVDGMEHVERTGGHVGGPVAGLEVTLAAGEYALELIQYFIDVDRRSRRMTR